MELDTRIQVVSLVGGLLSADDDLEEHEAAFLHRLRVRFQLPKGTAVPPTTNREEAASGLRALPDDVQQEAIGLLIEAAAMDGAVTGEEQAFLQTVAEIVGLDRDELGSRIEQQLVMSKPQPFGLAARQEDDL